MEPSSFKANGNPPPQSQQQAQNKLQPQRPQQSQYNRKCTAVKRLLREAVELANPTSEYSAHPLEDNLFEWHFTILGPKDSEFESGIYHGRIFFPPDYPMKPPEFSFLTPNGRFATGEKICLSISSYHPETWLPSWSIRTALVAIISFMTTSGSQGNIGELDYPVNDRRILAKRSLIWKCPTCGINKDQLAKAEEEATHANIIAADAMTLNPEINENQNIIGTSRKETSEPITNISNCLESEVNNFSETLGEEFAELTLALRDGMGSEMLGMAQTHQQEQGGDGDVSPVVGQDQEVDLASLVQQASCSGYLDFGIGTVVAVIMGLFFRRLFMVYPSLGFGLF